MNEKRREVIFGGKRNERRRLTGDIDRPDHRGHLWEERTTGLTADIFFDVPLLPSSPDKPRPGELRSAFRSPSHRFATF